LYEINIDVQENFSNKINKKGVIQYDPLKKTGGVKDILKDKVKL